MGTGNGFQTTVGGLKAENTETWKAEMRKSEEAKTSKLILIDYHFKRPLDNGVTEGRSGVWTISCVISVKNKEGMKSNKRAC